MECWQAVDAICRGDKSQAVLDHLAGCASCRAVDQATVVTMPAEISHTDRIADPTAHAGRRRLPWILLAVVAPVAAGLVGLALYTHHREQDQHAGAPAPAPPPPPAPAPEQAAPAPPPENEPRVLSIDAEPAAAVTVDGEKRGTTPLWLELERGKHQIELRADGYETVRRTVEIGDGEPMPLAVGLSRSGGRHAAAATEKDKDKASISYREAGDLGGGGLLSLATNPPARLLLDGRDTGRTAPILRMPVAAGAHAIELRAGGATASVKIIVKPNQEIRILKQFK